LLSLDMKPFEVARNIPRTEKAPEQKLRSLCEGKEEGERLTTKNVLFEHEGGKVECEATYRVRFSVPKPLFSLERLILRDRTSGREVDVKALCEPLGKGVYVQFDTEPTIKHGYPLINPIETLPDLMALLHEIGHL